MTGLISILVNYYGYFHLSYYSSRQFLRISQNEKSEKGTNKETAQDLQSSDQVYVWLSKW